MIHFDLPKQKSSIIKVIGVGGGGGNAVNHMYEDDPNNTIDFIICNTDAKAIEQTKVPNKIQLGPHLTQGLGAGANPEVGKKATEESLQEIKTILELNTKMAFVTAGMGGGTGTGGAPIVAKACKELGVLTVGIVTTPFAFEGPKRMAQAKEGIDNLRPHVDTLLVISNEKLRQQYGNLKMKEAWAKADNVLATAAKCITDIINSRGHIIVDFADVCTVMKNGGAAFLGKAEAAGENRAQVAVEEALNSPLLNDSDIKGAKWILLNINSAEGDHEFTMDEIDIITNYIRMQAGENTDLIVGQGYDNTLDDKIGITLIATGFDQKDPFKKAEAKKQEVTKEVVQLNVDTTTSHNTHTQINNQTEKKEVEQPFVPTFEQNDFHLDESLMPKLVEDSIESNNTVEEPSYQSISMQPLTFDDVQPNFQFTAFTQPAAEQTQVNENVEAKHNEFVFKPVIEEQENISLKEVNKNPFETSFNPVIDSLFQDNELPPMEFKYAEQDVVENKPTFDASFELDEEETKRRMAIEKMQKLRSLHFSTNDEDVNRSLDEVPAYLRKNLSVLGNKLADPNKYYQNNQTSFGSLEIKSDEVNQINISSRNKFLDGANHD